MFLQPLGLDVGLEFLPRLERHHAAGADDAPDRRTVRGGEDAARLPALGGGTGRSPSCLDLDG